DPNENLAQNGVEVIAHRPPGIMRFKSADITNPPDVVAGTVGFAVRPPHPPADQVLAFLNCLEHRTIAITPAANVVYLTGTRSLKELPGGFHEVKRVDVITSLLAAIPEHDIRGIGNRALHQIGEKAMQLRTRMAGTRKTTAAEANRLHAEITPIFLHEYV